MRLMDPDTVMGRPTEGANTSKEPTQAHPDVSTMDAESARRESIAAKILQRAELSKTARHLQQRLALAMYKTRIGCPNATLDELEPQVEEQYQQAMARKRRAEHDLLQNAPSKRQHLDTADDSSLPALPGHSYPRRVSLYDAMMLPSMSSSYDAVNSSQIGLKSPPPRLRVATDSGVQRKRSFVNASLDPAQNDTLLPTSPVSSARDEVPGRAHGTSATKRPASLNHLQHQRTASMPLKIQADLRPNGNGPFSPVSAHTQSPIRPISSSDPTFKKSAPEFVAAANALTSFTRGASEDNMLSPVAENAQAGPSKLRQTQTNEKTAKAQAQQRNAAKSSQTSRKSSKVNGNISDGSASGHSADAAGESDRESAAELMLYLATSPSPTSSNHAYSPKRASMEPPAMPVKGRKLLFGDKFDESDLKKLEESARSAAAAQQAAFSASPARTMTPLTAPAHIISFDGQVSAPNLHPLKPTSSPRKLSQALPYKSVAPPSHVPQLPSYAYPSSQSAQA